MEESSTKPAVRRRKYSSIKVLVADTDLDVHQLVRDILEINFRDVQIERALSGSSFLSKINEAEEQFDLILYNNRIDEEQNEPVLAQVKDRNPEIANRIVIIAESEEDVKRSIYESMPYITRPFSLDNFGEVVQRTCAP